MWTETKKKKNGNENGWWWWWWWRQKYQSSQPPISPFDFLLSFENFDVFLFFFWIRANEISYVLSGGWRLKMRFENWILYQESNATHVVRVSFHPNNNNKIDSPKSVINVHESYSYCLLIKLPMFQVKKWQKNTLLSSKCNFESSLRRVKRVTESFLNW